MQLKSLVVFTERCQQDMRMKWGGVAVRVIPLYLLSSASFILSFIFKLCHKACISVWSKATCILSWHRNGSICCSVCFSGKIVEMWLNTSSKFGLCLENFPEEKCILIYRTLNCVEAHNENVQSYFQVSLEAYMDRRIGYIFVRVNVKQSGKSAFENMLWKMNSAAITLVFFLPVFPLSFCSPSWKPPATAPALASRLVRHSEPLKQTGSGRIRQTAELRMWCYGHRQEAPGLLVIST